MGARAADDRVPQGNLQRTRSVVEIEIRAIEERDYSAVTTLFVAEILGDGGRYDEHRDRVAQFFARVGGDDDYAAFVACADGRVVGFVCTVTMDWMMSASLFIQCIAVDHEYQRRGVGTRLLQHVEAYARDNGIAGVGLQSGVQRTAAHAFYERNGYTRSNYYYRNF